MNFYSRKQVLRNDVTYLPIYFLFFKYLLAFSSDLLGYIIIIIIVVDITLIKSKIDFENILIIQSKSRDF